MAPPHRTSCLACVKSKRRCDIGLPRCKRCATKGLACDYAGNTRSALTGTSVRNQDQTDASRTGHEGLADTSHDILNSILTPAIEMGQDATCFVEPTWPASTSSAQVDHTLNLSTFPSEEQWLSNSNDIAIDGYVDSSLPIFEPGDDYITTGAIYEERTRFASRQFRMYPEIFYTRGQNPFIHKHSYTEHLPPVISDALSACALYSGKNTENELFVFGDISRKAKDLAEMQRPFLSPVDLLASTQALLLYQIMRLFDGDIRQRADAESHETILISWTEQLLARVVQGPLTMDPGALSQDSISKSSWNDWIFEESCRRTILTSFMLQGTYSFLKFGYDNVTGKVNRLCFTAQAALWNARSEYHWRETSKEKHHFKVTIGEWDSAMEGVKPEDLEELGIMIQVLYKGIDIICEWLGKENLHRLGVEWTTSETREL
jgi:Fungal Zn(2)-Cys(6) binuclear cluster domain